MEKLRILSRGSNLAMKQVEEVMANFPEIPYEIIVVETYGDKHKEISLITNDETDFFTREIDALLLANLGDIAIHSAKDMPFPLKPGLKLIALTPSLLKSDSLVSNKNYNLDTLPLNARIGTSSATRKNQMLSKRPDVEIVSIRGTIEERLELLNRSNLDAIIVATCALQRLEFDHLINEIDDFKAHPLQGNLGIVTRFDSYELEELFSRIDTRRNFGQVFLTGFGPGDPELLTLKALKVLKKADLILYDDLLDKEFITSFNAEKVYVGKRAGSHSKTQAEINDLIARGSMEGKTVVRLKGGDPLIFGHAGEEINYLLERYLPVEVIPGITAASAGASQLGISLTLRNTASSVLFSTGHNIESVQFNISGTTAIYMAANNLTGLTNKALNAGYPRNTPIALISNISKPDFKVKIGRLNSKELIADSIETPLLVIIGNSINEEIINYYIKLKPKILVTGTSTQDYDKYGTVIHTPLIKIEPIDDFSQVDKMLTCINTFDMLIFTSRYGVKYFFERLHHMGFDSRTLSHLQIVSIGKRTTQELKKYSIKPDLQPYDESSVGLLKLFFDLKIENKKILIPRSDKGLPILPHGLMRLKNRVTLMIVYQNVFPADAHRVDLNEFKYVAFSSPSGIENFHKLYGELPAHIQTVIKGPETRKKLVEMGWLKTKNEIEKIAI